MRQALYDTVLFPAGGFLGVLGFKGFRGFGGSRGLRGSTGLYRALLGFGGEFTCKPPEAEVMKGDFYESDGDWKFSRKMGISVGWTGSTAMDFNLFLDGYEFVSRPAT